MLPAPDDAPDQQFYHAPPSWFGRYVGPWVVFLPVGGGLLYFWLHGPHSAGAHLGYGLAEALAAWILYKVLTDKSVTRLTLGAQQVSLEEGSKTTILPYSEIKGFSEKHTRDGSFTLLEPLSDAWPSIRITPQFTDYNHIRKLLAARVTDFDAPERARHERALAQATQALLQDPALGPTPDARQAALQQATIIMFWLTLVAVPLGLWLLIDWPHELVTTLGLAVPLLALGTLWWHRGAVSFASGKDDPRPDVLLAIAIPSVMLLLRLVVRDSTLSWRPLWPVAGSVVAVFGLLLVAGSGWGVGRDESPLKQVVLATVLATCYGLAAAYFYNNAFDGGRAATRYVTHVEDKYQSTGKGSRNYLYLKQWGPTGTPGRVAVSSDYYARKQAGDTVTMRLYHGRLGADWVGVAAEE